MDLLLIEDDERIAGFLARGLNEEGHHVEVAGDGALGLERARSESWDAIVLDLMLPTMDGREICRRLRADAFSPPILMLTALDSTEEVVAGLRLGADDYLTKPFAFDELLARIETLRRRRRRLPDDGSVLRIADLVFDRESLIVRRGEDEIELTSLEYALLEFFMLNAGRVLSRAQILESVWEAPEDALTNVVDVYVRRLRLRIDDGYPTQLIKTVRGRGYRFVSGE